MELYPTYIIPLASILLLLIITATIVIIMRTEKSLGSKVIWLILTLFLPLFGSFIYAINYIINKKL